MSACVGRAQIIDAAWPPSTGEAIHTSTFLGHPVGCAMALAQIQEITDQNLVQRSAELGLFLQSQFSHSQFEFRGLGLMAGLDLRQKNGNPDTKLSLRVMKEMLRKGYIILPEGEHGNVISFTPPLVISKKQLGATLGALSELLPGLC